MKLTKFFAMMLAVAGFAVGCEPTPNDEKVPDASGAITLEVNSPAIELGKEIVFTVMQEGKDVTAAATIYSTKTYTEVENPYTPATTGTFSFYATKGKESSPVITVTVMASVPELPADAQPDNTKFNHRILLIDHTGVNCGNCPRVMDGLVALAETEAHNHYNEVCVHGGGYAPSGSDKAYSDDARIVDQFYQSISRFGYPNIRFNFYDGEGSISGVAQFVSQNTNIINSLVKADGADAGIAVAANGDSSSVFVSLAVKAAVEQEYKVSAWLLENNIYNPRQSGASEDHHKLHNFALRKIGGQFSKSDLSGDSLGVIKAGETKEYSFELPIISNQWVVENMDVLIIVSAKDEKGRFEVVNTASCKVNDVKEFEYL